MAQFSVCDTALCQYDKYQPEIPVEYVERMKDGREARLEGDLNTSIQLLEYLLQERPDYYLAHYNLALSLALQKKYDKAIKSFENAMRVREKKGINEATIFNSFGWTYFLNGNYEMAKKLLLEGIENQANLSIQSKGILFNNLGLVYMAEGEIQLSKKWLMNAKEQGYELANKNLDHLHSLEDIQAIRQKEINQTNTEKPYFVVIGSFRKLSDAVRFADAKKKLNPFEHFQIRLSVNDYYSVILSGRVNYTEGVRLVKIAKEKKFAQDAYLYSVDAFGENLYRKKTQKPLQQTVINSIGMEFVLIPAGRFTMGSSFGIGNTDEYPPHNAIISHPFYLQKTEVIQRQWKEVMGDNPSDFQKCGDDCPVESVSWEDAHKFIKKLNQREKTDKYRLPTEAEWEYACRAGTTTLFSFGNDKNKLIEHAWFRSDSNIGTHKVGIKKPNGWGLYDMHGNVWEWVEDDWHKTYDGAPADGSAWIDELRGADRVIRGGSWAHGTDQCRSAYRSSLVPDVSNNVVGLRLVRSFTSGP
jgi:formylglycine-generating enzyme required for sulfatase activity